MKKTFFTLFLLISGCILSQQKYITRNGIIQFTASVPSAFNEIKGINNSVSAVLNTENGEIAVLALIKGFRFKNALMEEHFNENYIESDKYPKATFKGKLIDFDNNNIEREYTIKGTLKLHGKSNEIETRGIVSKDGEDTISIASSFIAKPEEYDIKIPSIVSKKIADDISVSFEFQLKRKQKIP